MTVFLLFFSQAWGSEILVLWPQGAGAVGLSSYFLGAHFFLHLEGASVDAYPEVLAADAGLWIVTPRCWAKHHGYVACRDSALMICAKKLLLGLTQMQETLESFARLSKLLLETLERLLKSNFEVTNRGFIWLALNFYNSAWEGDLQS